MSCLGGRALGGALATCLTLATGALGGCGNDAAALAPQGFAITELRVPLLGCPTPLRARGGCRHHRECGDAALCVLEPERAPRDREPLTLTCAPPIGAKPARERCERGDECESGLCGLAGVCLEPCGTSADCDPGKYCRPVEVRAADDALAPVMACTRSLVLPAGAALQVSPAPFQLRLGLNEIVVPAAPDPALVLVQGSCRGGGISVVSLHDHGSQRLLYDQAATRRGRRASNTVLHDGSALAALLFPNNPQLSPGVLRIGVRVPHEDQAEVVVASRAPEARLLDLNVFYVGGGTAFRDGGFHPGSAEIRGMLAKLNRRYRALGLGLGDIREYDVVGALREELAVLEVPRRKVDGREVEGRPERLDELFALSAGVDDPGINLFIISDMGGYVGIAGGIPGPLGVHGSQHSGVAIAVDVLGDLSDADLVVMHELSHYMGLFHTTESTGTVLDPLADTPECLRDNDRDDDHHVSAWECEGQGADNLMFWSGTGSVLTAQQIEVLASSAILR